MSYNIDMQKIYSTDELSKILYPVFDNASVQKAFLFGSYAKGNANSDSDVDIVMSSNETLIDISFFYCNGRCGGCAGQAC